MSGVSDEDIERLANRMAMLISDDGEADNAGRAVGQLARRIGLSGGDLKEMVLSGAGRGPAVAPAQRGDMARLERELADLRRSRNALEDACRSLQSERDQLIAENGAMRVALYRRQATMRLSRLIAAGIAVALLAVAGVFIWYASDVTDVVRREAAQPMAPHGGFGPIARVRSMRAPLFGEPDRNASVLMTLSAGTPLVVHRMVWNMMMQWAEVDVDGRTGYIAATDIE